MSYLNGVRLACGVEPLSDCVEFGRQFVGDAVDESAKTIASRVRQLNTLKNPTVSIARTILKGGQAAINDATRDAFKTRSVPAWAYLNPLAYAVENLKVAAIPPRDASLQKVYWKLKWHEDALNRLASTPDAFYPNEADLKNWVVEAFIEKGVSAEERDFLDKAWRDMWAEVEQGVADYAKRIGNAAMQPLILADQLLNIPAWAWWTGGAVLVVLLGFVGYKVLIAATPVVAGRYLPVRSES